MFTRVTALANLAVTSSVLEHVKNGHLNAMMASAKSRKPGYIRRSEVFPALEICAETFGVLLQSTSCISLLKFASFIFFLQKYFMSLLYN